MNCDLHTHSTFSDGTFTPAQIVAEAKRLGISVALTDHNTTLGLPLFLAEAEKRGVVAVAGIEFSTVCKGHEFHLLGLFLPPESFEETEKLAARYRYCKKQSNIETVARLVAAGYDIDYAEIVSENPNGNINRAHIATKLIEKGYIGSVEEAFETLLLEEAGFYQPPKRLATEEAIAFLVKMKALPILAHPLKEMSGETLSSLLPDLITAGLVGIETIHSSYSQKQLEESKKIAEEFSLETSGGSDFHGKTKPGILLGVGKGNLRIPDSVRTELSKKYASLYR